MDWLAEVLRVGTALDPLPARRLPARATALVGVALVLLGGTALLTYGTSAGHLFDLTVTLGS
ncbi:hypothetical protein ACIQBJ_18480 [Kitasatospora sp. NPDC088391]|uniref:hypothetical protein n=1 Tax=Kitasatospora sp. NPDC088391 TaxID=3364074 RepID=UPI003807007D